MMRARLPLALGAIMLTGCPQAGPLPRCADAWKEMPAAARTYDFSKDAKATARGNEGYGRYADRVRRDRCTKPWTVLVYMAADAEDLAAPARRDLGAMEDPSAGTGSTERADVVAELHPRAPAPVTRLHLFRAPAAGEGLRSPIVEARDEDRDSPEERLSRFITWGVRQYPSEHIAVIVWGHGLGFRPRSDKPEVLRYDRAGTSGGLAFDEARGTALDTPGLDSALRATLRARSTPQGIDLYASDACLMQSVEVLGEIAGAARFVVGSEQIEEDYVGLPYRAWLPLVNGSAPLTASPRCKPDDEACNLAAALPATLRDELARIDARAAGFTLSAVSQERLVGRAVPALLRLGEALDGYVREDDLRRINVQVLLGADRGATRGTPGFRGGTRDAGVFLARVEAMLEHDPGAKDTPARAALAAAVKGARAALDEAVIAASFGPRYATPAFTGMTGVSLFLPHDANEWRARGGFFATSILHRTPPSFRGWLDRVFAPPPS